MNQAAHGGVVPNQITSSSIKEHPLALIYSTPESPKQYTESAILNFPKDEKFSHGEEKQKEILLIKNRLWSRSLSLTELLCMLTEKIHSLSCSPSCSGSSSSVVLLPDFITSLQIMA